MLVGNMLQIHMKLIRRTLFMCAFFLFLMPLQSFALTQRQKVALLFPDWSMYFGVNLGGGATTWKYLVDTIDPPYAKTGVTPIKVKEGGPSWGLVFGVNVNRYFAMELQYMHFADSQIYLDPVIQNYPVTYMISHTQAYSLSGKFYLPLGDRLTAFRAFSAVGVGYVIRSDVINKRAACVTPYMSAGISYNFTKHMIVESGFQYYTGFGASEILPVQHFIPFAWDAYFRMAYQL